MTRPNLFESAPNELTQDAFFYWLLSWLNYPDSKMFLFARAFLLQFDEKLDELLANHKVVLIAKQYKHIDILVGFAKKEIPIEYQFDNQNLHERWVSAGVQNIVVIEDKVHSTHHDNQLNRYKQLILDEFNLSPLCIYLKSGYCFKDERYHATQAGYKVIDYVNINQVTCITHDNAIFKDFSMYNNSRFEKIELVGRSIRDFSDITACYCTHQGQEIFLELICDNIDDFYNGKIIRGSTKGKPFTQHELVSGKNREKRKINSENPESIFYRIDKLDSLQIQFKQYLKYDLLNREIENIDQLIGNIDEYYVKKRTRLNELRVLFERVAVKYKDFVSIKPGKGGNKKENESQIGTIIIKTGNWNRATLVRIKAFIIELSKEMEQHFRVDDFDCEQWHDYINIDR